MHVRRALLALSLVLTTGCGLLPGDSDGTPRERFSTALDNARSAIEAEVDRAVAEAKERSAGGTGDIGGSSGPTPPGGTGPDGQAQEGPAGRGGPQGQVIRTDTNTAFDYAEYTATLEGILTSLEQYWSTALPEAFGVPYRGPSRYAYYRLEQGAGPSCAGEAAPARNAFYCPPENFIAWDETGLMIPYYVQAGDFAAAFVLAHEFGHAMQASLPRKERLGVLVELQADCFAGAWARAVQDQGLLDAGDLDEATMAVLSARDVPGTDFTDPRAHGTGFERTRAFSDGYESGPGSCSPAPARDWLVGRSGS